MLHQKIDRRTFLGSLSTRFYPILRAEGFRGSGSTLRRIDSPVIHIFNFQGSSGGERCYLNLGVHLTFLTTPGESEINVNSLKESQCAFRSRLPPPNGFGWSYGSSVTEMEEVIESISEPWSDDGHQFFERYADYPTDFRSLIETTDEATKHPAHLLTLARIAFHLEDHTRCDSFAQSALDRCPERASGLRADLQQLLDRR